MFTRKLSIAAIAAGSLLFMAARPDIRSFMSGKEITKASRLLSPGDSSIKNMHEFNAEGLCVCLSHYSADELLYAPKISLHKQVAGFVHDYNDKNGFFLDKIKTKSFPTFTLIDNIFCQYNLPVELKYLAVIESKLENKSVSGAGAAGIWQLMPDAARSFGLKVKGATDERRNNYKSTMAAAKCLIYLNKMFDDWLLTLAAYNCGPGRVLSAIKKSGSRDYWVLQNFLPEETRKHVKKFIAIHYYFEGHGSLATLTKKETKAHIDAVADFAKRKQEKTDTLLVITETVSR